MSLQAHIVRSLTFAMLVFGIAGCGLSEYEGRMEKQRKRIKAFDETNAMLDDPFGASPKMTIKVQSVDENKKVTESATEVDAWPFDFYLRLPKGYGTKVEEKNKEPFGTAVGEPFPLFRFTPTTAGEDYFLVAANVVVPPSEPKEKVQEKPSNYTEGNFRTYVQRGLEDFVSRVYKTRVTLKPLASRKQDTPEKTEKGDKSKKERFRGDPVKVEEFTPLTPKHGKPDYREYERIIYTGASRPTSGTNREDMVFQAYYFLEGTKQFCLVTLRSKDAFTKDPLPKTLEATLATLDVTQEGKNRRAQYQKAGGRR